MTVYKFKDLKIISRNYFKIGIFINNEGINRYNNLLLDKFSPQNESTKNLVCLKKLPKVDILLK